MDGDVLLDCGHSWLDLADLLDGRLSPDGAAAVSARIESCDTCRAALALLQKIRGEVSAGRPDAPAGLRERVLWEMAARSERTLVERPAGVRGVRKVYRIQVRGDAALPAAERRSAEGRWGARAAGGAAGGAARVEQRIHRNGAVRRMLCTRSA